MVGEKRPRSGRSPDAKGTRKIPRFDIAGSYSRTDRTANSNTSSRQSSVSHSHGMDMGGYGTPRSRSPPTRNGSPTRRNLEAVPKALQNFVLAISKHEQASHHLQNVQDDFAEMEPKCTAFPALQAQKYNRVTQAKKGSENTQSEAEAATTALLDTLYGFLAERSNASPQDSVSRNEYDSLAGQLSDARAENRELRRRMDNLEKLTTRLETENRHTKTSRDTTMDRISGIEAVNRSIEKTIQSAVSNYKLLEEQTQRDKTSFRNRCSDLQEQSEKIEAKQKESIQSISQTQTTYEAFQHQLEDRVMKRFKEQAESISALRKALDSLDPTMPPDASHFEDVQARITCLEIEVRQIDDGNADKDEMIGQEVDKKLEESNKTVEKGLRELKSELMKEIQQMGLTTEAALKTAQSELIDSMNQVKGSCEGLDAFKNDTARTNQLVDAHTDILQRHEVRLNSVTTDDMIAMMINQWQSTYPAPDQLKGYVDKLKNCFVRLHNLEQHVNREFQGLTNKLNEVNRRVTDMDSRPSVSVASPLGDTPSLAQRLESLERIIPNIHQLKKTLG